MFASKSVRAGLGGLENQAGLGAGLGAGFPVEQVVRVVARPPEGIIESTETLSLVAHFNLQPLCLARS